MLKLSAAVLGIALTLSLAGLGLAHADEAVHWSYEGATGPANWGSLSADYATCSEGEEQSPIDIPVGTLVNPDDLVLNYEPTELNIVNNGHAIQVDYEPGSTFDIHGTPFTLEQFHFHSLSEHTVAGEHAAMEMHLLHKAADGTTAVTGVLIKPGAENPAYQAIFDNMPATEGEPVTVPGETINVADLLPADKRYYRYDGSLTTPGCTEGVSWYVLANEVELSQAQIDQFQEVYDYNYRPVQPLNSRTFLTSSAPPASVPAAPKPASETAAAAAMPATLPKTGGSLPIDGVMAGLGSLIALAGLYLRRNGH